MDKITKYASAKDVTNWSGEDRHKWVPSLQRILIPNLFLSKSCLMLLTI